MIWGVAAAGLPMKIADPGTELLPEVETTSFEGREVRAVRVRYDSDRWPWWALCVDPDDARLVGARFWNQGPEADGEHLVMEGLAEIGALRLPAVRHWSMNEDGRHLGDDRIEAREGADG